jgi:hypothetical protein
MENHDRKLILKDNYKQLLKDAKKIDLETPEHFLTVLSVFLEDNFDKERFSDALNYLDTFIKYRSSFVRELLEVVNDK